MNVKLIAIAGPPSVGKTAIIKQIIRHLNGNAQRNADENKEKKNESTQYQNSTSTSKNTKIAYLKIDVVQAWEDKDIADEFGIPTKKVYSGDMCPDHMGIMIIRDALKWAEQCGAEYLLYESAGLCLRCTPYTTNSLGICVLSAISGIHTPLKMAPMIALADVAVVTKIDLISQAEKEVFQERIREVSPDIDIIETNAIHGTGMRYLMKIINKMKPCTNEKDTLRGVPPLGVCTICIGKKETGWQEHFGVIRSLDAPDNLYRGE